MRSTKRAVVAIVVLVAVVAIWAIVRFRHPGDRPYVPTRLEWLVIELNAEWRVQSDTDHAYSLEFFPLKGKDTVLIAAEFEPGGEIDANIAIEAAKLNTVRWAQHYGWEGWVKVETRKSELPVKRILQEFDRLEKKK